MQNRTAEINRKTNETAIQASVTLEGTGIYAIDTGIGFLDHLLSALSKHSKIDIKLQCKGDLHIDDHHTVEDCALVLGQALSQALGDKRGIVRFGYSYAPLDEALSRAVVDLSGRPFAKVELNLTSERLGNLSCQNVKHFVESLAMTLGAAIHLDLIRGENDHHKAESAFKALALALKSAVATTNSKEIPSTKGVL